MNLSEVISWKWPGARCVVRGDALERWDGPMAQPTQAEIDQAVIDFQAGDVAVTERSRVLSRHKDILATVAWSIRYKDPAAWAAMTPLMKRNAVLAEADNWRDIRVFIEKSL